MRSTYKYLAACLTILLITIACIFSNGKLSETEMLATAVAMTLTASADENGEQDNNTQPLPTITLAPTNTKPRDPTATPKPCNDADFVSETIEDDTEFDVNESFTKTWRLKNAGTCTWNTNYELVFVEGNKMSGPNTKKLTQNVAPGEQVDISVDLKAPNVAGSYTGKWNIKSDEGTYLLNYISVVIEAKAVLAPPPLPPAVAALTLNYVQAEGGSVRTGGAVHGALHNVGDTFDNKGSQVFASFDMTGIPAGSTITEVIVDFTNYDKLGDPWGSLGYLRLYQQDFLPLDGGDYFGGVASGALVRWSNDAELLSSAADPDLISAVQSKVGSNRFEVRLQFNDMVHNGDLDADMVRFGAMKLHVTYELP